MATQSSSSSVTPTPAFSLTAKQVEANEVLASNATHVMLFGGSRSGKTFVIVRAICMRAIKAPRSRHAILRFRFNAVKQSVLFDTFPKVMELCFPGVPYEVNKSDWFAQFSNGSEVWFGGLDDKERTEKILGQEHSSIFLNECSQIPWNSRNMAVTRLAQKITYNLAKKLRPLALKMYYDCNPPSDAHWSHKVFVEGVDPDTKRKLENRQNYASLQMNPRDNVDNLPASYLSTLESLPARMRLRFLDGDWSKSNPSALWDIERLDRWRVTDGSLPDMQRIVVAVDPSGADDIDNADNDEIGIMVAGLGTDGNGYVLEDLTCKGGPAMWGKVATNAFERHAADLIVCETNFGGAMVQHVIRTARPRTPCKMVTASRGKVVRAEPISSLTEQGKIRMAGEFRALEDELCAFTTYGYTGERSPNRADAFVWAFSELFPGLVREEKPKPEKRRERAAIGHAGWLAA